MNGIKDCNIPIRRLAGGDGKEYFFGYYDIPAYSGDDSLHLCNRISFRNRLNEPTDEAELGVIMPDGTFNVFAKTTAWNFQQGAMLQWSPDGSSENVVYNIWDGDAHRAVVHNIKTDERRICEKAVANVSPDGKYGLSLNFPRIWDFRPGYGYCNIRDPFYDVAAPVDDGIFLTDMQSGKSRLLISYAQIAESINVGEYRGRKIVVNHITFNTTSNRFLFLARCFPTEGGSWATAMGTSDLSGNVYWMRPYGFASHYHWRDGETYMIYGDAGEGNALYEMRDQTQEAAKIADEYFEEDIHCSYSPNREWFIGDAYFDAESYRPLYIYHIPSKKGMLLGRFYSEPPVVVDIRCDLHTRWNHRGDKLSFDSTHEGFRGVYELDIADVLAKLK